MMSRSKTEKTENASTTDSTKGKRRSTSPPKDIGDNVKTDVAMDIAVTLESFLDCSEDIKLRIAAAIRPIFREKHRFQHERDFYKSMAEKFESDKEALLREQTPLRCVMIFRKKIEKLETVFALTCDLPVHDMQKAIFTYVKDKKEAAMTEIYEKLEKLKQEQRVEVMNFFNQASTKQLAEYMFSYWRQSVKEKLNSCSILNDEDKKVVADLVLNTEKQLQDININDQYPVQFNHRFIKWMYYLIFSNDRRAKAIRKSVDDSPELNLFSFCSSIAELYATSSKVYHPGSSIIFKNTVTFDDIMSTLKLDLEVDDVITLKSVEILLKAGTTNTTKYDF